MRFKIPYQELKESGIVLVEKPLNEKIWKPLVWIFIGLGSVLSIIGWFGIAMNSTNLGLCYIFGLAFVMLALLIVYVQQNPKLQMQYQAMQLKALVMNPKILETNGIMRRGDGGGFEFDETKIKTLAITKAKGESRNIMLKLPCLNSRQSVKNVLSLLEKAGMLKRNDYYEYVEWDFGAVGAPKSEKRELENHLKFLWDMLMDIEYKNAKAMVKK